ncbi:MAG: HK97 family phage prohead protease [Alphaproteobacteria bacterium]|nr:HK97 family phage prohead protease [Alphaproteobacteria bacterium]
MDIKHMSCALRVKTLGGDGIFMGYASVFGELDQQNEIVQAGAFARSLSKWRRQNRTPALLWMHDPTQPIGIWQTVREDASGLLVEGRLALRTQKGGEAYELLKLGALTGLSIGYRVVASQIDAKRKARILTDVDLFEISLVTFPANEAARVSEVKKRGGEGKKREAEGNSDSSTLHQAAERLRQAARALTSN